MFGRGLACQPGRNGEEGWGVTQAVNEGKKVAGTQCMPSGGWTVHHTLLEVIRPVSGYLSPSAGLRRLHVSFATFSARALGVSGLLFLFSGMVIVL